MKRLARYAAGLALALAATQPAFAAPGATLKRATPVSVSGAPRSLVTLVVPVPSDVESADRVHYQVALSGGAEVLGRLTGELVQRDGQRSILLTLRVPAVAPVGLLDVADVVFTAEDGTSVVVPIILRVPAVQALRLSGLRELTALYGGDRIELAYNVQNLGNADERLRVRVTAPDQWSTRVEDGESVLVPAYGTGTVVVRLRVPPVQSAGSYNIVVQLDRQARGDSLPAATASTLLRVNEPVRQGEVLAVHPFIGGATSADGSVMAAGLRVSGPVAEGVILDAAFAPRPSGNVGLSGIGLANVGLGQVPVRATLRAENWRAEVGMVQGVVSPIAGSAFGGRGGMVRIRRGDTEYYAVAAAPQLQSGSGGVLFASSASRSTALGRFGVSVASLDERRGLQLGSGRALTAVGAQWDLDSLRANVSASAGLAYRQFADGAGLGMSLDVAHENDRGSVRAGVLVAPGGSSAFAPSRQRLFLSGQQRVGDFNYLDASVATSEDVAPLGAETRFTNASVGARRFLGERANVSGRIGRDASEGTGYLGVGGFEMIDNYVSSGIGFGIREWSVAFDARVSAVQRNTVLFSGATDARRAGQQTANVMISRGFGTLGQLSLGGNVTAAGAGVGVPGTAVNAQAIWSDLPLMLGDVIVRLSQEVRVARTSLLSPRFAYRTGARTTLWGVDVNATFERSPFLTDRRGRPAWMFGVRMALSTQLLTTQRPISSGRVFRDLNGNGMREEGEPGVAGVVLEHDRVRATTNRAGEYRVPQSVRGRLSIDPTSIPAGLLMHPRMLSDTTERRDIPLVPAGSVVVRFSQQFDDSTRSSPVDFTRVDVWVQDASGFEWVGRHLGDGRFAIEDVPVGAYRMRTSFARSGEQLRVEDLVIEVQAGQSPEVVVPVRGRSIRLINPPSGPGGGRVGPRNAGARNQMRQ